MTTISPVGTSRKLSILVATERELLARALGDCLRAQGHDCVVQEQATAVADALSAPGVDAVLFDTDLAAVDWDKLREAFSPDRPVVPEPIDAVERRHIAATLRFTGGNRRNAAQILGIARSTLLAKIRKYGLDRE